MKPLLLMAGFCFTAVVLMAQQFSPQVMASAGGSGQTTSMQLDWTLGELAVSESKVQDRLFTEGFHQPLMLIEQVNIVSVDHPKQDQKEIHSGITVTPNPVSTQLTVHFDQTVTERVTCQVLDANGNARFRQVLNTSDGHIPLDVSGLVPGLFFVQFISENGGTVTLFKLVKAK